MITLSSLSALVSLLSLVLACHFVRSAARTEGRVIQIEERKAEYGKVYAPIFAFRDATGAEHTVQSHTVSNPPEYQVGDTVGVLYPPSSPEDAETDTFFSNWGTPLITGLLAAFYMPLGLLMWHWPSIIQRLRQRQSVDNAA